MLENGNTAIEGRLAVDSSVLEAAAAGLTAIGGGSFDEGDSVDSNRSRNVVDGLLAHIFEAEAELVAHLVVDIA